MTRETNPESVVREIRRETRRKYSAEEKIRILLLLRTCPASAG